MTKPEYIIFKMKRTNAEALLHSLNYYKNIIESYGISLHGGYPRFVGELHELLRRKEENGGLRPRKETGEGN